MIKRPLHLKSGLTLSALIAFFCLGQPASVQSAGPQDNRSAQDSDITRQELARFDQFLDSHPEIAKDLRKKPSLVNDDKFLKKHPALQIYLQDHPGIREEIKENPKAFMLAENRYDRREDRREARGDRDVTRQELASFDRFLDAHREIAEQLHKNPSLVNNQEFVKNHPALLTYLQDHPGVREEFTENPNGFMRAENRYDRREDSRDFNADRDRDFDRDRDANRDRDRDFDRDRDANRDRDRDMDRDRDVNRDRDRDVDRDRDTTRRQLASFDRFLDSHRETAEQLRKNPSLVDNREFLNNHPALATYLQNHPGVREEITENPNAFMQAEARYDRWEDNRFNRREDRRDPDMDHDSVSIHRRFGEFLGGHSELAQQLSKDPSKVKNQEFLESHPELKEYLNANPEVRQELMANPRSFVKSSQQFTSKAATQPPAAQPKPKQ